MTRGRSASLLLAATGLALAAALLVVARPAEILAMARTARLGGVAAAFGWALAVLAVRAMRLALVTGPPLTPVRGAPVVAVTQLAVAVMPLRLGELALLPMLHAVGVTGIARGLSFAVVLRLLDMAALLVWAAVAALLVGVAPALVAALAAAGAALVGGALLGQRWLRRFARRHRHGRRATRRVVRQVLQVRRELRLAARSPWRVVGVAATSLAVWAGLWGLSYELLAAMGRTWSTGAVLAAVVGAAVGTTLPINAVGNFGTLEAGWTGALAAAGVPVGEALAAGFATHLWSLAFSAVLGGAAIVVLLLSQPGIVSRWRRAAASEPRTPPGDE